MEWNEQSRSGNGWRAAAALLSGIALSFSGAMGCSSPRTQVDYGLMAQAWNIIEHHYVDPAAVNRAEMTHGAISGMVDSLGDSGHSTFLTPAMVKELSNMERGQFKGIGVEIQKRDEKVVIVAPFDQSPAQQAGLRPGDVIVKVFDQDVTGWPLSRVVEKMSRPAGTQVKLTIEDARTGRAREVTLVRAVVRIQDVAWRQLPGTSVVHLRIAGFDDGVARDLRRALREIRRIDAGGIILDLRNNPGGILDEAVGVASQFLEGGNVLLAKDGRGRISPVPVEKGGLATDIPLAVLINGGSASAAEIVAGALEDARRATLIGEKTFGTGTVLREFGLSDGSALLLAIEEWLTPGGRSFWHRGISPQVAVSLPDQAIPLLPGTEAGLTAGQLRSNSDRQLLAALEILEKPAQRGIALGRAHPQAKTKTDVMGQ
jgi:carboxyl-terminal processing protease